MDNIWNNTLKKDTSVSIANLDRQERVEEVVRWPPWGLGGDTLKDYKIQYSDLDLRPVASDREVYKIKFIFHKFQNVYYVIGNSQRHCVVHSSEVKEEKGTELTNWFNGI